MSQAAARADLRELGWHPIQPLLTYDIDNQTSFEEEIPPIVREVVIEDSCAFHQSFTHALSIG